MADIQKNALTLIRIEKRTFQGRDFIDIRQYYTDDKDKFKPTQKGVTVPPEKLTELIESLIELQRQNDS